MLEELSGTTGSETEILQRQRKPVPCSPMGREEWGSKPVGFKYFTGNNPPRLLQIKWESLTMSADYILHLEDTERERVRWWSKAGTGVRESEEVGENWTTHLLLGRSRFVGVEGIKNLHLSDCGCFKARKMGQIPRKGLLQWIWLMFHQFLVFCPAHANKNKSHWYCIKSKGWNCYKIK